MTANPFLLLTALALLVLRLGWADKSAIIDLSAATAPRVQW
jgi:hypothetical protein